MRKQLVSKKERKLLEAALSPPNNAALAWKEFCLLEEIQNIKPAYYNLLPVVYKNLQKLNPPYLSICRGVYRHTWCRNQLLIGELKNLATFFEREKLPFVCLKGAALLLTAYQNFGLRVMGDLDIWIPQKRIKGLIPLLKDNGWDPLLSKREEAEIDAYIKRTHAMHLAKEELRLDLHWSILSESGIDQTLYNYQFENQSLATYPKIPLLCPEDMLIHLIFHGRHKSRQPLIRFIVDIVYLFRYQKVWRWDYFAMQADKLKLTFLMQETLGAIASLGWIELPSIPFKKPRPFEMQHSNFISRWAQETLPYTIGSYWYAYRREENSSESFYSFMMRVKGFRSFFSLIKFVLRGLWIFSRIAAK